MEYVISLTITAMVLANASIRTAVIDANDDIACRNVKTNNRIKKIDKVFNREVLMDKVDNTMKNIKIMYNQLGSIIDDPDTEDDIEDVKKDMNMLKTIYHNGFVKLHAKLVESKYWSLLDEWKLYISLKQIFFKIYISYDQSELESNAKWDISKDLPSGKDIPIGDIGISTNTPTASASSGSDDDGIFNSTTILIMALIAIPIFLILVLILGGIGDNSGYSIDVKQSFKK